jgi:hypothetical protein
MLTAVPHKEAEHAINGAWTKTKNVHELACRITNLGGTTLNNEHIVVLTNHLPNSYQPLIVSLELIEESKLTINNIITCLVNKENQQGKEGNNKSLALTTRNM